MDMTFTLIQNPIRMSRYDVDLSLNFSFFNIHKRLISLNFLTAAQRLDLMEVALCHRYMLRNVCN